MKLLILAQPEYNPKTKELQLSFTEDDCELVLDNSLSKIFDCFKKVLPYGEDNASPLKSRGGK